MSYQYSYKFVDAFIEAYYNAPEMLASDELMDLLSAAKGVPVGTYEPRKISDLVGHAFRNTDGRRSIERDQANNKVPIAAKYSGPINTTPEIMAWYNSLAEGEEGQEDDT